MSIYSKLSGGLRRLLLALRPSGGAGQGVNLPAIGMRVEENTSTPTTRNVNGTVRYADTTITESVQSGDKYGLSLNGTNEYGTLPVKLPLKGNTYTVAAWVHFSGAETGGTVFGHAGNTATGGYVIIFRNDICAFLAKQEGSATNAFYGEASFSDIADAGWHHMAMTVGVSADGTEATVRTYLDGSEIAFSLTTDAGTYGDNATAPYYVGTREASGVWYGGGLDDIRVYGTAISEADIQALASSAPGDPPVETASKPLLHYKFEDPVTSATVANDGVLEGGDLALTGSAVMTMRDQVGYTGFSDNTGFGDVRPMKPKYGLNLNGTNEWGQARVSNRLPLLGKTYTMCAWVNLSANGDALLSVGGGNPGGWSLSCNNTSMKWSCKQNSAVTAFSIVSETHPAISGTGWHHVAGRISMSADGNTASGTFWFDGQRLEGSNNTDTGGYSESSQDLTVGSRNNGADLHMAGVIDDVRIYDTELSDSDVASLAAVKPGSPPPALTSKPIIHYTFEDPVSSPIVKNVGTMEKADITLNGVLTNMRSQLGYYSFANNVGYGSSFTTDGVDDYIDSQLTLNGVDDLTIYFRRRYLSTSDFDLDGYFITATEGVRIGRNTNSADISFNNGSSGRDTVSAEAFDNELVTVSLTSPANGDWEVRLNGVVSETGNRPKATITNTVRTYAIGGSEEDTDTWSHFSNSEIYEYLIAKRVLTDDELTWLETGGAYGTPVDVLNDPDILLYYDFEEEHPNFVKNLADPLTPGIINGGEWSTVPRSSEDTTKDVQQVDSSYRTAVITEQGTPTLLDSVLISATGDFDISADFYLTGLPATQEGIISQYAIAASGRFWVSVSVTGQVSFFINGATNVLITTADGAIERSKWYNVRATRVGDDFALYLDGELVGTQTQSGISVRTTNVTRVMSSEHDSSFPSGAMISNVNINGTTYFTDPNEPPGDLNLRPTSYEATFPGSTNYADLGSVLIGASNDFDISLDVFVESLPGSGTESLLSQLTGGVPGRFHIAIATESVFRFFVDNGSNDINMDSGVISLNRWYSLRFVRVGDAFTAYLDGEVIDTETESGVTVEQSNTQLGNDEVDDFHGKIRNVRIDNNGTVTEYLTKDVALPGATLTNVTVDWATYGLTNVARGKPGTLTFDGVVPRDRVVSSPCMTLNGTNEYATATFSVPPTLGVSFWFKASAAGAGSDGVIGNYNTTTSQRSWLVQIEGTSGHLQCFQSSDGTSIAYAEYSTSICDNSWHHIAVNFGSGTAVPVIYVDGTQVTTIDVGSQTGTLNGDYDTLEIGRYNLDNNLACACQLDDVRIYDTALTDSQITDLAFGGEVDGAILHYPLCEGSGNIAYDVSGNENHGTINGANVWTGQTNVPGSADLTGEGYGVANWFDGNNDWFTYSQAIGSGATSLSLGCWVQPVSTVDMELASCAVFNTTGRIWRLRVQNTGALQLIVSGDGTSGNQNNYYSDDTIQDNQWTYCAVTWDGSDDTFRFYFDGGLVHEEVGSINIPQLSSDTTGLVIGNNASFNAPFEGAISQFAIEANAVWTPAEINSLMTAGKPSEVAAIRPNAYYFPDAKHETNQGMAAPTVTGAPETRVIPPMRTVDSDHALGTSYDGDTYFARSNLIGGGTELSIAFWASIDEIGVLQMLAAEYDGVANQRSWQLYVNSSGQLVLTISEFGAGTNVTDVTSVSSIVAGRKYHIGFTYNAGTVVLLVDGVEWSTTGGPAPASFNAATSAFVIGGRIDSSDPFLLSGTISQLAIEGAAWSPAEVKALMASGTPAEVAATRPNAYYFRDGNGVEYNQGLGALRRYGTGTPRQRVLPGYKSATMPMGTYFDGANDWFTRAAIVGSTTKLCISAWVYVDSLSTHRMICSESRSNSNLRSFQFYITTSGALIFAADSDGTGLAAATSTAGVVTGGQLHHVNVTYNAGTVVFEVDGTVVANTGSPDASLSGNAGNFELGSHNLGALPFSGTLSRLLVHKDPTVVWDASTKKAIRNASTTAEISAIVDGLGGTAWYFPQANGTETLQGIPTLTTNGAPRPEPIPELLESDIPVETVLDGSSYLVGDDTIGDAIGTTSEFSCFVRWKNTTDSNKGLFQMSSSFPSTASRVFSLHHQTSGNNLTVRFNNANFINGSAGWRPNDWNTITVTYDGENVRIWRNGTLAVTQAYSLPCNFTNAKPCIGVYYDDTLMMTGSVERVVMEGVAWSEAEVEAITATGAASEISDVRPDAYCIMGGKELLQDAGRLTPVGNPEHQFYFDGKVTATQDAGTKPSGLPAISYGPGVLAPGQSLDLYCGEDDTPYANALGDHLADGDYDFGDGDEGNILFVEGDSSHERLILLDDATDNPELIPPFFS